MNDNEKLEFIKNTIFNLNKNLEVGEITQEDSLYDIGLDSLSVIELQIFCEDYLGYEFENMNIKYVLDLMKLIK